MEKKTIIILGILFIIVSNSITWLYIDNLRSGEMNELRTSVHEDTIDYLSENFYDYLKDKTEKFHLIGYTYNDTMNDSISASFVNLDCLETFTMDKSKIGGWEE